MWNKPVPTLCSFGNRRDSLSSKLSRCHRIISCQKSCRLHFHNRFFAAEPCFVLAKSSLWFNRKFALYCSLHRSNMFSVIEITCQHYCRALGWRGKCQGKAHKFICFPEMSIFSQTTERFQFCMPNSYLFICFSFIWNLCCRPKGYTYISTQKWIVSQLLFFLFNVFPAFQVILNL